MPIKDVRTLKPQGNEVIMNYIRGGATLDYQSRVPETTKANINDNVANIFSHSSTRNQFMDALVNRIGLVVTKNKLWTNPLTVFKKGLLEYGETVEEIQTGLIKAKTYDPQREHLEKDLFATELVPAQSQFHTRNRQEYYKMTVNELQLKAAFLQTNGLTNFINDLMVAPTKSANWDEYLQMVSLIRVMESMGGFWHTNVPNISQSTGDDAVDAANARTVLKKIRADVQNLKFISTKYNSARMPVHAEPEDLVLLVTPEAQASMDVDALAAAFNISKMEVEPRIITIRQEDIGVNGVQAILTTKEFFQVYDNVLENRDVDNGAALQRNYFLHIWQIISASRFAPAIMYWTGASDEVIEVQSKPTAITDIVITNRENTDITGDLTRGSVYNINAIVNTDPADSEQATHVKYTIGAHTSDYTNVTNDGVLFIGGDEKVTTLDITAISTWIDPANPDAAPVAYTETVNIAGERYPVWPVTESSLETVEIQSVDTEFDPDVHEYAVAGLTPPITDTDVVLTGDDSEWYDVTISETDAPGDTVTVTGPLGTYTFTAA